jgi:hypothetical protein
MAQGDTASGDEYMDEGEAAALSGESDNDGSYKGEDDSDDDDDAEESDLSTFNTDDDDDDGDKTPPRRMVLVPEPVAPVIVAPVMVAPVIAAAAAAAADPQRRKVNMTLRGNPANPFGAASGIPDLTNHFGLACDIISTTKILGLRVRFVRRLGSDVFLVELLPKKISSVLSDIGRLGRGEFVAVEIKGDDATEIPPSIEYDLLKKWFTDELGRKRCPPPTSMVSLARAGLKTNVAANGTPGALVVPIIDKIGTYPVYGDDTKEIAVLMSTRLLEYLSKETPANVTAEHAAVCKPAPPRKSAPPRKRVSTAPVRAPTLPDEVIDSSALRRESDARMNGKRPAVADDERSVKVSRHDVASRLFGAGGTISMGGDGCVTVTLKFQSRAELAAILDAT